MLNAKKILLEPKRSICGDNTVNLWRKHNNYKHVCIKQGTIKYREQILTEWKEEICNLMICKFQLIFIVYRHEENNRKFEK